MHELYKGKRLLMAKSPKPLLATNIVQLETWGVLSSGMWYRLVRCMLTDVSEERTSSLTSPSCSFLLTLWILKMEVVSFFEMSVNLYWIIRHYIPKYNNIHCRTCLWWDLLRFPPICTVCCESCFSSEALLLKQQILTTIWYYGKTDIIKDISVLLTKHLVTKTYWGVVLWLHAFVPSAVGDGSGKLHILVVLPQREYSLMPIEQEAGWAP